MTDPHSASNAADARYADETELLGTELPDRRFVDTRYLQWLYDLNPLGAAFREQAHEDGRLVAHYALVPQQYRNPAGPAPFVFSLNAVTSSSVHRRGYFSELGQRIWDAARDAGVACVIGVTNDKSVTPVARLGWRHLGRLPVRLAVPVPGAARRFESEAATEAFLSSPRAEGWLAGLDPLPTVGWTNCWTPDMLRWRLSWPNCGPYALHTDGDLVAISTRAMAGPVPVAVIVKLALRHRGGPGPTRGVSARGGVAASCSFHRAPVAVYAGFNRWVRPPGVRLPERVRPVPLNLMMLSRSPAIDQDTFALDTFEFLDMDGF
jgi:hypothetical protein